MQLVEQFISFLKEQERKPSKLTIKNYKADVGQFIRWFEERFKNSFDPNKATFQVVDLYRDSQSLSTSSMERHLSSLRKFFNFLKLEGLASINPLGKLTVSAEALAKADPYRIKDFKDFLYVYNASHLTIKNYIIDIKQFFKWAEEVSGIENEWDLREKNLLAKIDSSFIEEYKNRLLEQEFLPSTVNRKLSSLRKYFNWAQSEGLVYSSSEFIVHGSEKTKNPSTIYHQPSTINHLPSTNPTKDQRPKTYSPLPPIRLAQKFAGVFEFVFDYFVITPLSKLGETFEYVFWQIQGKPVFKPAGGDLAGSSGFRIVKKVSNIKKSFFAPLSISTKTFPWHKKAWHHLRHTRPKWYRTYHSYPITHYFHLAILIIFMTAVGFAMYNAFATTPKSQSPAFAAPVAPPRILSFQGRLTDSSDNPVTTAATAMRMAIYNDPTASGAALLWEEIVSVSPDTDGIFSILLGNNTAITQSIFAQNATLYLGVTVGSTAELTPRQQLATVAFATNAEVLQGLPPITDAGVTTNANAVLALNSSGTVSIAGTATTTFQATSGQLTITGKPLLLQTNSGTGGNITFAPDGLGIIDFQKPIRNSSNNNNISTAVGALEVNDLLAILATSSGQSALTINQTSTGPLISASTSGTAKFTVDGSGNGYFAGNVGIGITTPAQKLDVNGAATFNDNNILHVAMISGSTTVGTRIDMSSGILQLFSASSRTIMLNPSNGTVEVDSQLVVMANPTGNTAPVNDIALGAYVGDIDKILGIERKSAANTAGLNFTITSGGATIGATDKTGGDLYLKSGISTGTGNSNIYLQTFPAGSTGTSDNTATTRLAILGSGNVGIGTTTPLAALDVRGLSGTLPAATISATSSFASFITDNSGVGDLFTASKSGATKFVVTNAGNVGIGTNLPAATLDVSGTLKVSGTTNFGGIAYTWPGSQSTNYVLQTNGSGTLSWVDANAAASSTIYWNQSNGLLYPKNSTVDLTIGGQSTASAKFAFINMASGNPTATISGNLSLAVPTTAGANTFNLLNNSTLNFQRSPGGDAGLAANSVLYLGSNGNVGIGTTAPSQLLQVAGLAQINTGLIVPKIYPSADSTTAFQINKADGTTNVLNVNTTNSRVGIGTTAPSTSLQIGSGTAGHTPTSLYATGTVEFDGMLYADGEITINDSNRIYWAGDGSLLGRDASMHITSNSNAIIVGGIFNANYDHGTVTNPTLFVQSATNPDTNNTQWLSLTHDTNDGIISTGVGDLVLSPASGNVGIGTTTPLATLDLRGNLGTGPIASFSGRTSFAGLVVDNGLFTTDLGDLITASSSAYPGQTPSGGGDKRTQFRVTNQGTIYARSFYDIDNSAYFLDPAASNGTALSLAGNISIGTTAPGATVDVQSSGGVFGTNLKDILRLVNNDTAAANNGVNIEFSALRTGGQITPAASISALLTNIGSTTYTGALAFSTAGTAAIPTERMRIDGSGNVGIGTTTPDAKLAVYYDEGQTTVLKLGRALVPAQSLRIIDSGGSQWEINAAESTFHLQLTAGTDRELRFKTGATQKMVIDSSGNVGIGTTTPTALLDVDGAAQTVTAVTQRAIINNTNAITTNTGATAVYGLTIDEPNITVGTVTPTNSSSLYISGAASEATNNYALWVDAGDSRIDGKLYIGDTINNLDGSSSRITFTAPFLSFAPTARSGNPDSNAGFFHFGSSTYTDNTTAESGTEAEWTAFAIQQPTLAATNLSVTTTTVATFKIANAPAVGTNETFSNSYALWVDAGNVRLDGTLYFNDASDNLNNINNQLAITKVNNADGINVAWNPTANVTADSVGALHVNTASYTIASDLTFQDLIRVEGLTIAGSAATKTVTNASILHLVGKPGVGANAAITSAAGLWVSQIPSAGTANIGIALGTLPTTNTYAMYLNSSSNVYLGTGNVGIGTTNPLATLDIRGTSGTVPAASVSATSSFASLIVDNSGVGDLFTASKSGATKFVITNAGNVGIGTNVPGAALAVSGGNNINERFPDGLIATPVNTSVTTDIDGLPLVSYTVTTGKTFYITSAYTATNCALQVGSKSYTTGTGIHSFGAPLLAGSAVVVGASGTSCTVNVNGFEATAGVTAKNVTASTDGADVQTTYPVTTGKTFYITNVYVSGGSFQIGSKIYAATGEKSFTSPLLAGSTVVLSCPSTSTTCNVNGYETKSTGLGGADVAEQYFVVGGAQPGDAISMDSLSTSAFPAVSKTARTYDQKLMGVITTNPGITLADDTTRNSDKPTVSVALNGRVPVKVSAENGTIAVGDPLTSSSTPGVAMKATKAGPIVAKALEPFSALQGETLQPQIGKILAFVNVSWYDPDVFITSTGDYSLALTDLALQGLPLQPQLPSPFVLKDPFGNAIDRIGRFAEIAVANLKAGFINAEQITTNSLAVTADSVTIGGQNLRDYILAVVKESGIMNNESGIISPIIQTNQLATDIISPLSKDSNLSISLHNSQFIIHNSNNASSAAVAVIDNAGNASFAGTLTSNELNASKLNADKIDASEASVSGTLRAGRIIADQIEGLNIQTSTLSAQYITNNYYDNFGLIADSASSSAGEQFNNLAMEQFINISSFSGQLAYVENLNAAFATFTQGLISLGPSSFTDLSVINQLSIGGNLILADAGINVLGQDLGVQPLRQGGISFLSGLVHIDVYGNLKVGGNAEFTKDVIIQGKLFANIISPIPGSDLIVRLNNESRIMNQATDSASLHDSQFIIHNSSDSAVLAINQKGDIVSSGSATFDKLNLRLVQPALAISNTELLATGSAGVATISAHQTEVTIQNSLVTDKSLIYITPIGNPTNLTPFLMRQTANDPVASNSGSFTAGIQLSSNTGVPFNWLIIN